MWGNVLLSASIWSRWISSNMRCVPWVGSTCFSPPVAGYLLQSSCILKLVGRAGGSENIAAFHLDHIWQAGSNHDNYSTPSYATLASVISAIAKVVRPHPSADLKANAGTRSAAISPSSCSRRRPTPRWSSGSGGECDFTFRPPNWTKSRTFVLTFPVRSSYLLTESRSNLSRDC